jgi:hypothetical protein
VIKWSSFNQGKESVGVGSLRADNCASSYPTTWTRETDSELEHRYCPLHSRRVVVFTYNVNLRRVFRSLAWCGVTSSRYLPSQYLHTYYA